VYEAGDIQKHKPFEFYEEQAPGKSSAASGQIQSHLDAFLNGASPELRPPATTFDPRQYYEQWTLEVPSPDLTEVIKLTAGVQRVPLPPDR